MHRKTRLALVFFTAMFGMLACLHVPASHPQIQMPSSILVVNVGSDVIRAGLSLTRVGIAEMGDNYTVGGTFLGRGGKVPGEVTLHLVTSSGKSIRKSGRLQAAPMGNYAFLVLLPKEEGQIKVISITSR